MDLSLLLGAAALGGALGVAWRVRATDVAMTRSARANLQRGLGARTVPGIGANGQGAFVAWLAARTAPLTPANRQVELRRKIAAAGLQGRWTVERVLAAKVAALGAGVVLAVLWLAAAPGTLAYVLLAVALPASWFAPDAVLDGKADDRRQLIVRALPDVIDQLCIMVEAGLSFDAALARTARATPGVLGDELARTVQDVQLGTRRGAALSALAERVNVPDVRRFVSSLRQAEQYGVPVAQVLRSEGDTMRDRQSQSAAERAQKLPVKILFPLVLCILPALLVVLLGPAILELSQGLHR
jgi:tight adherence protein C